MVKIILQDIKISFAYYFDFNEVILVMQLERWTCKQKYTTYLAKLLPPQSNNFQLKYVTILVRSIFHIVLPNNNFQCNNSKTKIICFKGKKPSIMHILVPYSLCKTYFKLSYDNWFTSMILWTSKSTSAIFVKFPSTTLSNLWLCMQSCN